MAFGDITEEQRQEALAKGKEVVVHSKNYNLLSPQERRILRNAYVEYQQGKCQHCGGRLSDSPNEYENELNKIDWGLFPGGKEGFLKYPVHLHHSHKTGMTIGAVHAFCNAWLWYYRGE